MLNLKICRRVEVQMSVELHKRLTREQDYFFERKAIETRFKKCYKKFIKKIKDRRLSKQSKLPITELFELDRKGELV